MQRIKHHLKNAFIPHHGNDYRPHALRHKWLHTYTAIVVAVKVVAVVMVSVVASPGRVSDISPTEIIQLSNVARQQNSVGLLSTNTNLTKAAEAKAADMAAKHYFAHISPAGTSPWYWFKQAGYSYTYAGENLAMDFVASQDVIDAWLQSPSHRSNLLSSKYKDIGVAVTSATIDGAPSLIIVQMFGAPIPTQTKKVVTTPSQTPSTTVAKEQAAQEPVPTQVLGETATVTAPAVPTILTPAADSLVRTSTPEVVGKAEAGSIVTLFVNGTRQATATTGSDGVYSVTPSTALPDGEAKLQVTATARGLTSNLSGVIVTTVDTSAPTVDTEQSILLPSYFTDRGYDVFADVTGDPTTVVAQAGSSAVPLVKSEDQYVGAINPTGTSLSPVVSIALADAAGNTNRAVLADTSMFSNGVVASTSGPIVSAIRVVFFSRTFLVAILALLFMASTVNIVIERRHQHHPTIIHSLLLLFLVGTFLVI